MSLENESQMETFEKDEPQFSQESQEDNLTNQILSELNEAGVRLDVDRKDQASSCV